MAGNLHILITVGGRLFGLYLLANGLFAWAAGLLIVGGDMPYSIWLLPIVKGLILWFLAKPCADLVTNDLK